MTRIIGAIVALGAVLAFGARSNAAVITFNVTGSSYNTASALAPPPGYFTSFLGAGSNITINTDANGDGTVGDVSLVNGTLYLSGPTDLGDYGTFNSTVTTYLSGATGTLNTGTGQIAWNALTAVYTTDPGSTFFCTGAICTILAPPPGLEENTVYPLSVYTDFVASQGVVPIDPFSLGTWQLTGPAGFQALNAAFVAQVAANGTPTAWYVFSAVPEPGFLALTLLGLGGIALRARKA